MEATGALLRSPRMLHKVARLRNLQDHADLRW